MKTSLIYQPKGRAGEYAQWACNIYRGCGHACTYCYAPTVIRMERGEFNAEARPRYPDFLERLEREARALQIEDRSKLPVALFETTPPVARLDAASKLATHRQVLLCFTTDPYQPIDDREMLTRRTIEILHHYGMTVTILTKGGKRALRDIDIIGHGDAFASTLTLINDADSHEWEPHAALPAERMDTLRAFHERGIPTWVSLEPVIDPRQTLDLIAATHRFVDLYKVGAMNYHPHAREINWPEFAKETVRLLEATGKPYILKDDLKRHLPA